VQRPGRLPAAEPDRDKLARPDPPKRQNARLAMLAPAANAAAVTQASVGAAKNKPTLPADAGGDAILATLGSRTAIYDISARVVYLPNGEKLEAHSGFGEHMDDPRSVGLKKRGATPPNVYELSLRERLFHGVRAIRLTPLEPDRMFGREGILAHSYLLGPNGQSNGCVSMSDYPRFLNAFLNGEIERLVVVDRLVDPPSPKTAVGWLSERVKAFFKSS
jgi:Tlde1 domain